MNKLTSLAQWLASKLGRPANQILIETDEHSEYVLPTPVPVILAGNVTSGGAFQGNSATGTVPVTEASAAQIGTTLTQATYAAAGLVATIAALPAATVSTLERYYAQRRIGRATATTAGGAFANLSLVAALAGYYGVCRIVGVICQNATAAGTLTFESPAGTAALPSVFINGYSANVINKELSDVVITHATLVDAQAIVVDGAGFGAGDVTILFEYHYET